MHSLTKQTKKKKISKTVLGNEKFISVNSKFGNFKSLDVAFFKLTDS